MGPMIDDMTAPANRFPHPCVIVPERSGAARPALTRTHPLPT
jgi:hypothetical protein